MSTAIPKREGQTFNFILASLAIFLAVFGLIAAVSLEHTPTTIPFPHSRLIVAW